MHIALRNLRLTFGFTQQELADNLEISAELLLSIEKGHVQPSFNVLKRAASLFSVPIEFFLYSNNQTNLSNRNKLLKIYDSLDEVSRGKLLERAIYFAEKSGVKENDLHNTEEKIIRIDFDKKHGT